MLPAEAERDKPAQWVDIQDVYGALKECPARHKLLVLDLAHGLVDPRWGALSDRVAETLEADLEQNPPPFPALCSCSAGQTSLYSDTLPGSVFAYYLDQALQGHADREDSQSITVKKLFSFVEEKVDRWARVNRGVRQLPRIFPKEFADFPIVDLTEKPPEPVEPKAPAYPKALKDGWKKRDDLRGEGAVQRAPRPLLRLEANLQRLEDRWRHGAPPAKDEIHSLKMALDDFDQAMKTRSLPRRSLASWPGAKEDLELAAWVTRFLDGPTVKEAADKKDGGDSRGRAGEVAQSAPTTRRLTFPSRRGPPCRR